MKRNREQNQLILTRLCGDPFIFWAAETLTTFVFHALTIVSRLPKMNKSQLMRMSERNSHTLERLPSLFADLYFVDWPIMESTMDKSEMN